MNPRLLRDEGNADARLPPGTKRTESGARSGRADFKTMLERGAETIRRC
jgi:hypothetical protein